MKGGAAPKELLSFHVEWAYDLGGNEPSGSPYVDPLAPYVRTLRDQIDTAAGRLRKEANALSDIYAKVGLNPIDRWRFQGEALFDPVENTFTSVAVGGEYKKDEDHRIFAEYRVSRELAEDVRGTFAWRLLRWLRLQAEVNYSVRNGYLSEGALGVSRVPEERLLGRRFHRRPEDAAGRHEREVDIRAQGDRFRGKLKRPQRPISRSEGESMRIMVTGGAGFIASHVAQAYVEAGHEVLVLDNLSSGKKENVPEGARFVFGDAGSETAVEAIRTFRPEVLCHHAAQINVRRSVADPVFDAKENIVSTLVLLEAAREHGVRKVIFSSSGGAGYGEQEYFPADEKHPLKPVSPYGVAKVSVELYLQYYRIQYGLEYTALRYSNVYGPRQDPHGEAGVVAIFCERLLTGQAALINGDGSQTRDYVYVGDVVRANLAALTRGDGLSVNIGTGIETDVNTLFRALRDLSGSRQEEIHGPAMPGEQRRSVIENGMAFNELGWYPDISLDEGLALTLAYFRDKVKSSGTW